MDIKRCFVKFVQFNDRTIQMIINQTVKFSTVYEFNDLNEQNVIVGFPSKSHTFIDKLKNYFSDANKRENVISKIKESVLCNDENIPKCGEVRQYCQTIASLLRNPTWDGFEKIYWSTIVEHISYIETGIFCLSGADVFKDDAAQLMFAHYANNLRGLALVYTRDVNTKLPTTIEYKGRQVVCMEENDYVELIKGKCFDFFCCKSKNWKYENEYRFFSTPGLQTASSIGLTLKGLFYTDRFDSEAEAPKLKLLRSINEKYYENPLFIERLIRSYQEEKFLVYKQENSKPKKYDVLEYLEQLS
ncbi:MAG: DUF2971 domain-containing protein [Candidatus Scalindua rubra]|uniref:Uncharacterized protein n=1 Tax=Candidatus Scalindua brodae TaxID=237368 RepID=A0A0B0EFB4_9BACT|nr:MAG: hypothetical protein SCABRO_02959 [Candidatus Scalindua brodae]MBZ0109464.1 DUF2971 domain-containing protein [Candidatus Scalindua rubra]TWU36975.1 hypothetical protein S225a_04720 [Candidatus Brocadiaceae bacterium S225]